MSHSTPLKDQIQQCKEQVHKWIKECVLEWNLCPFAKAPFYSNRVHIEVYPDDDPQAFIECVLVQAYQLIDLQKKHHQNHTTLIATPAMWAQFEDYWECVGWVEECLIQAGFEGVIQVASFHPAYQFEGPAL